MIPTIAKNTPVYDFAWAALFFLGLTLAIVLLWKTAKYLRLLVRWIMATFVQLTLTVAILAIAGLCIYQNLDRETACTLPTVPQSFCDSYFGLWDRIMSRFQDV